jgi:prevent-host-death family protein
MAITPKPVEETMKLSDTKQQFSSVINRVAKGEANVIVEKSGLPVAVIVSMDEYQRIQAGSQERQDRFEKVQRLSEAFADLSTSELEEGIQRAVREAREQYRADRDRQES